MTKPKSKTVTEPAAAELQPETPKEMPKEEVAPEMNGNGVSLVEKIRDLVAALADEEPETLPEHEDLLDLLRASTRACVKKHDFHRSRRPNTSRRKKLLQRPRPAAGIRGRRSPRRKSPLWLSPLWDGDPEKLEDFNPRCAEESGPERSHQTRTGRGGLRVGVSADRQLRADRHGGVQQVQLRQRYSPADEGEGS